MAEKGFRVGIVGFGRIAETHLEAWNSCDGVQVRTACDNSEAGLEKARSLGLSAHADIQQMLESVPLDAVSICSPPAFHAAHALACLEAGVPVLCEKPVSIDVDSTQSMLLRAEETKVPFQMATKFRHMPDIRKSRELLRHGVIGDPVSFTIEFASQVDMSTRWNSRPAVSGGGVLIDNGCHAVDTVRFLLSGIAKVQAVALRSVQALKVEDSAILLATTECGVTGRISLSWSLKSNRDAFITIQGTRGLIEIGWKKSTLSVDGEHPVQIGEGYNKASVHKRMMGMFRDLVDGQEQGWMRPEDVLASAMVVEAAYRSMQTSRWARIPAPHLHRNLSSIAAGM